MTTSTALDREALAAWYDLNRERSEEFFDSIAAEAYETRPISLRHPFCFYEGHLPAFNAITVLQRGFGDRPIDAELETLFQRGIDPENESGVTEKGRTWPSRIEIRSYAASADRAMREAILTRDVEDSASPVLRGGLALHTILEHEQMHQETLRYILHRLPYDLKIRPEELRPPVIGGEPPRARYVRIPAGRATLGALPDAPFAWDNELPRHSVDVDAFSIDVYSVTNRDYLEFVEAGGYENESLWDEEGWAARRPEGERYPLFWERQRGIWLWRGMWDLIPLPMAWPVYVTHAEASAYARWKGNGTRLPTEAEFHRAAFGSPDSREREHPWGDAPPDASRGNFDFASGDPVPVGSFPLGRSAWGVEDLVGNGWEWTSTPFGPFDGFEPMASYPQYSADFFDGKHWVMKGASPATAKELVRASFRNWFRGTYPYMYAKFRTARSA